MTDYETRQKTFEEIYDANLWGGKESRSGEGSSLKATAAIREELPKIIESFGIESILDVPCGDFNWMNQVQLSIPYTGIDIVPAVIQENKVNYRGFGRSFQCKDAAVDTLPQADLIICRDMLQHLTYTECWQVLYNFVQSGARYLLVTSYNDTRVNEDLPEAGGYRPLNLFIEPFVLGPALYVVNEGGLSKNEKDKAMYLLKIGSIR